MNTIADSLKPMFEDSLETLDKLTINCSDKDLENICINAADTSASANYTVSNIIGSSVTSAAITRSCLLCGNSTESEFNIICPRCQKIWNILIDTFQEDVKDETN